MEMVFGTPQQQAEYFRKKGLDAAEVQKRIVTKEEETAKNDDKTGRIFLDVDTLADLTEDEIRILNRARHRHDEMEVYMQSDVSFYDRFYSDTSTDPLTMEAHRIRRIYRNYRDYLNAQEVRYAYLERILEDEFDGDEDLYWISMRSENCPYWVPPRPMFVGAKDAKSHYDETDPYDMKSLWEEPSQDEIDKVMNYLLEDVDDIEIGKTPGERVYSDVCTDLRAIKYVDEHLDDQDDRVSDYHRMSINEQFNSVISSWYRDDAKQEQKTDRVFYYSPENIRARYYRNMVDTEIPEDIDEIMNDPDYFDRDHTNWDEMVFDPDTGSPMKRLEFHKRQMIKTLGQNGWGELNLMDNFGVGTRIERKKLTQGAAARRKNKLKPETLAMQRAMKEYEYTSRYDDLGGGSYDYEEMDSDYGSSFLSELDKSLKEYY